MENKYRQCKQEKEMPQAAIVQYGIDGHTNECPCNQGKLVHFCFPYADKYWNGAFPMVPVVLNVTHIVEIQHSHGEHADGGFSQVQRHLAHGLHGVGMEEHALFPIPDTRMHFSPLYT